jgi:putative FmdB family regulatory protein
MPLYEYQCGACGHRLEALQKLSDEPLVYCPECNEAQLKKLISAAAFRLKGTGWYETDFKSKQGAAKEDSQGQKSDDKSETKSESKSDSTGSSSSDSTSGSSTKTTKKGSGSASQSAST